MLQRLSLGQIRRAKHLQLISDEIAEAIETPNSRLLLSVPPQYGKSTIATVGGSLYALDRFPRHKIMVGSYATGLSQDHSETVRDYVDANREVLGWGVDRTKRRLRRWATTRGGSVQAVGVATRGRATGYGYNLGILDDPFAGLEEAYSQKQRDKVWRWWTGTFLTRKAPGASIVVISTRWHIDDLTGRLIDQARGKDGEQWKVINIPAIALEGDLLGRAPGEPIWPEYRSLEELEAIKRLVGALVWSCLYQGNPLPEGGSLFPMDQVQRYRGEAPGELTLIACDLTTDKSKVSDYCAYVVMRRSGADVFVVDVVCARHDFNDQLATLRSLHKKYPEASVLIEKAANGSAVKTHLKAEIPGINLVTPKGSKPQRAAAVSPFWYAHNVHVPYSEDATWVDDFLMELAVFDKGPHDDRVDAFVHGTRRLLLKGAARVAMGANDGTRANHWRGR